MEEIVRRLRSRCQESIRFLKDSLPADGEEETEEEDIGSEEELDTPETDEEIPDIPDDPDEQDSAPPQGPMTGSVGGSAPPSGAPEPEADVAEEPAPTEHKAPPTDSSNPLDNGYAVNFKLGDSVAIAYSDGTSTDAEAVIDGYDSEGFYRIKLADGKTINGITDIALISMVSGVHESTCACGSTQFVNEGGKLVCDICGRLHESSQLKVISQDKPKKKTIIRAEQHPISTANKPNISESFEDEEDGEEDEFAELVDALEGEFWTRLPELVADIEELGYEVLDSNQEYIIVNAKHSDSELQIYLGGTARTITLDFKRTRRY